MVHPFDFYGVWKFRINDPHMGECHLPEQKSVEAVENWDFVYALISRQLKLHSWNFWFRKFMIWSTYD